jgi:hypothetical protein
MTWLSKLFSFGKPLPFEYQTLEGTWQNNEVYMKISATGGFWYRRRSGATKISINTWIKDYSDQGFTVSILVGSTDFIVDKKPYVDSVSNATCMIVDGRTLVKQDRTVRGGRA